MTTRGFCLARAGSLFFCLSSSFTAQAAQIQIAGGDLQVELQTRFDGQVHAFSYDGPLRYEDFAVDAAWNPPWFSDRARARVSTWLGSSPLGNDRPGLGLEAAAISYWSPDSRTPEHSATATYRAAARWDFLVLADAPVAWEAVLGTHAGHRVWTLHEVSLFDVTSGAYLVQGDQHRHDFLAWPLPPLEPLHEYRLEVAIGGSAGWDMDGGQWFAFWPAAVITPEPAAFMLLMSGAILALGPSRKPIRIRS
jgi:hypothetical protein